MTASDHSSHEKTLASRGPSTHEAASSEWREVKITINDDDAANHSGGRGLCPNRNDGPGRRAPYGRDRP